MKAEVLLSDASDIGNFDVTLTYDAQVLTVTELTFGEGLSSFTKEMNIDTPGQIIVGGFAGADVIPTESGNFVLFTVTFDVSETASGETSLRALGRLRAF